MAIASTPSINRQLTEVSVVLPGTRVSTISATLPGFILVPARLPYQTQHLGCEAYVVVYSCEMPYNSFLCTTSFHLAPAAESSAADARALPTQPMPWHAESSRILVGR